jgi:hypothetical protein
MTPMNQVTQKATCRCNLGIKGMVKNFQGVQGTPFFFLFFKFTKLRCTELYRSRGFEVTLSSPSNLHHTLHAIGRIPPLTQRNTVTT